MEEKKRHINIEIEEKEYEKLKLIAKVEHRTIKAVATMAVLEHIDSRIALNTMGNILSNV